MDAETIQAIGLFATPILACISTLFWLLNKEKDKRLEDRDRAVEKQDQIISKQNETIELYRFQIIPSIQKTQESVTRLADLYERQERRGSDS